MVLVGGAMYWKVVYLSLPSGYRPIQQLLLVTMEYTSYDACRNPSTTTRLSLSRLMTSKEGDWATGPLPIDLAQYLYL